MASQLGQMEKRITALAAEGKIKQQTLEQTQARCQVGYGCFDYLAAF